MHLRGIPWETILIYWLCRQIVQPFLRWGNTCTDAPDYFLFLRESQARVLTKQSMPFIAKQKQTTALYQGWQWAFKFLFVGFDEYLHPFFSHSDQWTCEEYNGQCCLVSKMRFLSLSLSKTNLKSAVNKCTKEHHRFVLERDQLKKCMSETLSII